MGVKDLWQILSEICERKPLTYLTGQNVAVDLSGWVVEAMTCEGLNTSKNPHLKNLFFRVSKLLQLGVHPIFVTEGKPPDLKEEYFKEKNQDRYRGNYPTGVSRSSFDETLRQCQDLLTCLGVPCIQSSGEAEAFCAFLCLKGIVSGVITEDNDAFLYGADVIYRDFSIKDNDSHVNVYCLKSEKNKLQLDRKKLVALALLLGCDYCKGVPGIGKEYAKNLISELNSDDVLQRFKDWKNLEESELFPGLVKDSVKKGSHCSRCGHSGAMGKHKKEGCSFCDSEITCYLPNPENPAPCKCQWHVNEEFKSKRKTELKIYSSVKKSCPDFPEEKVIEEYLNFNDIVPCEEKLIQKCPDMLKFQEKASNIFGWTFENSFEKVMPLITSWQQYKLKKFPGDTSEFIYEPVEILKEHSKRGDTYYDVQWKLIGDSSESSSSENLITQEYGDQFGDCYKELVEAFNDALSKQKEEKQSKGKSKKLKAAAERNRKMDEFFKKTKPERRESSKSESAEDEEQSTKLQFISTDSVEPKAKKLCT